MVSGTLLRKIAEGSYHPTFTEMQEVALEAFNSRQTKIEIGVIDSYGNELVKAQEVNLINVGRC